MLIKHRKILKSGNVQVLVELKPDEVLASFYKDGFYKLGEPLGDEVVQGDMLTTASQTSWCPVEQAWV
jgi:hypothetical protein